MGEELITLTAVSTFLGMSISLWMALYLLARGNNNRLTFRAVLALLALAFYYLNAFTSTFSPGTENNRLRALAVILAVTASHNLTHYLLPPSLQKNNLWFARGIVVLGIMTALLLIAVPVYGSVDPVYMLPPNLGSPELIKGIFQVIAALAIANNIRLIFQSGYRPLNRSFYVSLVFGTSVIVYGLIGVVLNLALPRFLGTMLVLTALCLLGYSVARYQALIEQRTVTQDLPFTALAIFLLTGIYILATFQFGLSTLEIALVTILAITTHSAYDLVKDFLNRIYRRQQRTFRQQIQQLTREPNTEEQLTDNLRRGLAILCHNLESSRGFIGVRHEGRYFVRATLHSLPLNSPLPSEEVHLVESTIPVGRLRDEATWIVPAYGVGEQVAVVGIGPRSGLRAYTESDLYWLEDVADQIGMMVTIHAQKMTGETAEEGDRPQSENFLSTLALRMDPKLIKCVEEGFRNINDYIQLGGSPLAARLDVGGDTHIERGKAVHQILAQTVQSLRPSGDRPSEPLPREWFNYVVLHDAYVEDLPDREIMAKLYISEGTYYRTRRKAIRGVTRALLEAGLAT